MGGKTIVNEEKRIGEFQVNSATYGVTVPIVIGTSRIAGNVIDYFDFTAIQHKETQGGKGGAKVVNKSYTYTVAAVIGLAEGPIKGVGRIWKDKDVFVSNEAFNFANTQQSVGNNMSKLLLLALLRGGFQTYGLTPFLGTHGQAPWSYTQTKRPDKALPYSGLAYMAGVVDLGSSASLPNLNFEVVGFLAESSEGGDGLDANPADTIKFILSDPINGLGFDTVAVDESSINRLRIFCKAADILVSLPLTEQRGAHEIIKDICSATNTIHFWSQNRIKFVPRCDERLERNGVVFEPVTVPEYNLDADDFLEQDDGALVTFERADNSEAYNHATVEFLNRENDYQTELAEHKIQVDINRRGLRSAPTVKLHYIHTKERAEYIASLIAMDSLYGRTKYRFRLGWSHCLLEPGDFVTLTEPTVGLTQKPVIMDTVEEDENGALECVAKERPPGIYSPAKYDTHPADRPTLKFDVAPGATKKPAFYEPPFRSGDVYTVSIAACGQNPATWGGAQVWVTIDGETYQRMGEISGPSRYGTLVNAITAEATELVVQLEDTTQQLLSASAISADANATLCCIGEEWFSYEIATLLAAGQYRLSGLRRGAYGTTVTDHAANENFVRYDPNGFSYAYKPDEIGRTLLVKLTSFNLFGTNVQSTDDAVAYSYTIRGPLAPPDVTTLMVEERPDGSRRFTWPYTPSEDFAGFLVRYSYGTGAYWQTGIALTNAPISASPFDTKSLGSGTVTVMIKAITRYGIESKNAAKCTINLGDKFVDNEIWSEDFGASGWAGIITDGHVAGGKVVADDNGNLFYSADVNYPRYGSDEAPFYQESYLQVEYIGTCETLENGYLRLDADIQGTAQIFYRRNITPIYGADEQPFYKQGHESMYVFGDWVPYAGQFQTVTDLHDVRVIVSPGILPGTIKTLTAVMDLPDVGEIINDVVIAAGGTRLPITKTYKKINHVGYSLQQVEGQTATAVIVVDKSIAGPLIKCLNASGTAVAGTIDARVAGVGPIQN